MPNAVNGFEKRLTFFFRTTGFDSSGEGLMHRSNQESSRCSAGALAPIPVQQQVRVSGD
jgi:hypothetical protein